MLLNIGVGKEGPGVGWGGGEVGKAHCPSPNFEISLAVFAFSPDEFKKKKGTFALRH